MEEHINSRDREMKQRADETLKAIADGYLQLISDRLKHELDMIDESEVASDAVAVNHHKVLADVYRSMLGKSEEKRYRQ